VLGFAFLTKGADLLVDGSSSIAVKYKISQITVGLTIVAFGTSMPEMIVNVIASASGYNEVVFGNIIGSNIFNLYLILGISGIIFPLTVTNNTIWKEIPFSLFLTVLLFILLNDRLIFNSERDEMGGVDGIILLVCFALFIYYIIRNMNSYSYSQELELNVFSSKKSVTMIGLGIVGLGIGGKLVVDSVVNIAEYFNVSKKLVGLTIVSVGTSLPELATSIVAALKRNADIAVGNVVGSNIINITFVMGISALIRTMEFDATLNTDIYVLVFGTFLLFLFMFTLTYKKLDRWEALIFIVGIISYAVFLFIRK